MLAADHALGAFGFNPAWTEVFPFFSHSRFFFLQQITCQSNKCSNSLFLLILVNKPFCAEQSHSVVYSLQYATARCARKKRRQTANATTAVLRTTTTLIATSFPGTLHHQRCLRPPFVLVQLSRSIYNNLTYLRRLQKRQLPPLDCSTHAGRGGG